MKKETVSILLHSSFVLKRFYKNKLQALVDYIVEFSQSTPLPSKN